MKFEPSFPFFYWGCSRGFESLPLPQGFTRILGFGFSVELRLVLGDSLGFEI